MTNQDLYDYIEFVANRDGRGNIVSPDEYAMLLPIYSEKHFQVLLSAYEVDDNNTRSMRRFKKTKGMDNMGIAVSHTGRATVPDDFYKLDEAFAHVYISPKVNSFRKVEVLTLAQYTSRLSSVVEQPTMIYPVCTEMGSYIQVFPYFKTLAISYIRKPLTPVYNYTITVDGVIQYNSATSVDLDYEYIDKLRIANIFLQEMGINMRDGDLIQMAELMKRNE